MKQYYNNQAETLKELFRACYLNYNLPRQEPALHAMLYVAEVFENQQRRGMRAVCMIEPDVIHSLSSQPDFDPTDLIPFYDHPYTIEFDFNAYSRELMAIWQLSSVEFDVFISHYILHITLLAHKHFCMSLNQMYL